MRTLLLLATLSACLTMSSLRAQTWEERAWHALNKKVTVELVDSKLSEAINFVQQYTNLTIIIDPKVRAADPVVNLRVNDMDAGTFIKWLTQLTNTYADVADQAIYISDKPNQVAIEDEKNDLAILAASLHAEIPLPPQGVALTDTDRVQIAIKLMEKYDYKPTDFPGPDIGIGIPDKNNGASLFGAPPK